VNKLQELSNGNGVSDERKSALQEEITTALLESVRPAYTHLLEWAQAELALVGNTANGVGSLPGGTDYFALMLAETTTTEQNAEELHAWGLSEVTRIHGELEELMQELRFEGSREDFFAFVANDPRFYFPNTDEGRQAYLDQAQDYLDAMQEKLPDWFGRLPKSALEVRRLPPNRERPGELPSYTAGTLDGSRPGVVYVSLADMRTNSRPGIEGVMYHEGFPGHHLQYSLALEIEGLPLYRRLVSFDAHREGWALYTESLALEMGAYQEPWNRYGPLFRELMRAIRVVLDTGIHALGWSEQQAMDYAAENSPSPMQGQARRYFVDPGWASAYMVGMKAIREMRSHAEAELGDRFGIRAFHDEVLGSGSLPLELLERRMDKWIAADRVD
jgi:uncharacterized protein (DUF885 family)